MARELRAREDGLSDPLAPEEVLCVSVASVLDRERQLTAIDQRRDHRKWEDSEPATWLNKPGQDHPLDTDISAKHRIEKVLEAPVLAEERARLETKARRDRLREARGK